MKPPTLQCQDLALRYAQTTALDNVTLQFPPRALTCIVGPNGSGKTTLLNVLSGFVRPDSGQASYGLQNLLRLPPQRIAQLGIVRSFQEIRVFEDLTVTDHLLLAGSMDAQDSIRCLLAPLRSTALSEIAVELLTSLRLTDYRDAPASRLSFGQRKALSLATGIMTDAKLLLLDEPLSGLDPEAIDLVGAILIKLVQQGRTIVVVEHDLEAVRQFGDWLIVMSMGRVAYTGVPRSLLERSDVLETFTT